MGKLIKFLNIFLILIVIVMLSGCSKKQSTSDIELNIGQIRYFYDAENNTTEVSYEIEIKNNSLYNIELNIIFEIMVGYNKRTEKTIAYPINTKQYIYETSAFTLDGHFYNINYRIDDYKYDSLLGTYKYWLISILSMTILLVAIYWITVTKRKIEFKKIKNFFKKHFWIFFFLIIPFIPYFVLSIISSTWNLVPVVIIVFGIIVTILVTIFAHFLYSLNHVQASKEENKKQKISVENRKKAIKERVPKFRIMTHRTRMFLFKVHEAFDELSYYPNNFPFDYYELESCAINTLNHSEELEDAKLAAKYFQFVRKKYKKIHRKVKKHYAFWKSISYEKQKFISLVSDEDATGVYFVTNAFYSNYNKVSICGHSFGENIFFDLLYKRGIFYLHDKDDYSYCLRFGSAIENMILLDENKNKLCVLTFSKNNIYLRKNKTDYEIINYDGGMGIYEKNYIYSLTNEEEDKNKMLAFISWDILDVKSEYGIARIDYFDQNSDLEMFIMFAMSGFLMYHRYMEYLRIRMIMYMTAGNNLLRMNNALKN